MTGCRSLGSRQRVLPQALPARSVAGGACRPPVSPWEAGRRPSYSVSTQKPSLRAQSRSGQCQVTSTSGSTSFEKSGMAVSRGRLVLLQSGQGDGRSPRATDRGYRCFGLSMSSRWHGFHQSFPPVRHRASPPAHMTACHMLPVMGNHVGSSAHYRWSLLCLYAEPGRPLLLCSPCP